jgi:VanZ family protein
VKKFLSIVPRWFPALFIMVVIFAFSSQSGDDLPDFVGWDYFIKKMGHAIGYGLLALSYLYFFKFDKKRYWFTWFLAIVFATTDEFHQSFVAGRHASAFDVLVFDNFGAVFGLWLYYISQSLRRSRLQHDRSGK